MRKGGGSLNPGRPGLADKGSPLVGRPGGPGRGLGSLPDGREGGGPDDGPGGRLGERPDGPCGPRGALVLAAVEGFLKGRKASRVPHCVPRVPHGGRKGVLHGDTGGCSSRVGTRTAADAEGLGAAGAAPGIKARVLSGGGHGSGIPLPPQSNPPPGLSFTREVGQEKLRM